MIPRLCLAEETAFGIGISSSIGDDTGDELRIAHGGMLKESYIKAGGFGWSFPFDAFAFLLGKTQPLRLEIDPALDDRAAGRPFSSLRPTMSHLVALCAYLPDQATISISLAGL